MPEVRGRYPAGLHYCLVPPAGSPEGDVNIAEATPPLASLIARTLNVRVNAEVGRAISHCSKLDSRKLSYISHVLCAGARGRPAALPLDAVLPSAAGTGPGFEQRR